MDRIEKYREKTLPEVRTIGKQRQKYKEKASFPLPPRAVLELSKFMIKSVLMYVCVPRVVLLPNDDAL